MSQVDKQLELELLEGRREILQLGDDPSYSVRRPTHAEEIEARKCSARAYAMFLRNNEYLTKDEMKRLYEERGVVLPSTERILEEFRNKEEEKLVELFDLVKDGDSAREKSKKLISGLTNEISKLRSKIDDALKKESELFGDTVENLAKMEEHAYLVAACAEKRKKTGKKWTPVYSSVEVFMNSRDSQLGLVLLSNFLQLFYGLGASEAPFVVSPDPNTGS